MSNNIKNYKKECRLVINEFKKVIKSTDYFNSLMQNMLKQLPTKFNEACKKDYIDLKEYYESNRDLEPKTIDELFERVYETITKGPEWRGIKDPFNGLPLINVFAKTIATEPGFLFFGHVVINEHMKRILDLWKRYLLSEDSKKVLTKDGWLGMSTMDMFRHNKKDKYYGFKCWNDFFIREFRNIDESRPLAKKAVVVSACDCHIITFHKNLKYNTDFFRIKGDIYSLENMLGSVDREIKKKFVGGSLIQGYLSAENYHRYHSPVTGTLVYADVIPGTYFFVNNFLNKNKNIFCGQNQVMDSQQFLSNIQTRAVYVFKTKEIGYVAFIAIGMTEVSSCIVYDKLVGKVVKKGEEIGHFQYGGSTNIIIFDKEHVKKLKFTIKTSNFNLKKEPLTELRSSIAELK